MKKCRFCAEEIQDEAIKCRYCGEFLDGSTSRASNEQAQVKSQMPDFFMRIPWFVGFLFLGPFVIPLIWKKQNYSLLKKQILTIVIILVTIYLIWACFAAIKIITNYYNQVSEAFQGIY